MLDAKTFKSFAVLSKRMVDDLSIGGAKFSPLEFADRLSNYGQLEIETDPGKDLLYVHMPDCQGSINESCDMPACHMKKIGLEVQNILKKPMYIKYLFGKNFFAFVFYHVPLTRPLYTYILFVYTILGSIEREEKPTVIKEKKQKAKKSTGDGTGLVSSALFLHTFCLFSFFIFSFQATQTYVDDGKKDAVPDSGASLTEKLVESTMEQLKDAFYTNGRCDMSRNYSNENDDED